MVIELARPQYAVVEAHPIISSSPSSSRVWTWRSS